MLKVKGKLITHAGLILETVSETPTRMKAKVVDVFFPKHFPSGFQVAGERAEWIKERNMGRVLEFWKKGSRCNFEVGGDREVIDWNFTN